MTSSQPVVVGFGRMEDTAAALHWAAREAVARGTRLRVVRCYQLAARALPWESGIDRQISAELHRSARIALDQAVSTIRADHPDVEIEPLLVEGFATDVLVEQSADAAVTVVGSRHLTALGRAVLGSVGSGVAALGRGPIVVLAGVAGLPEEVPPVVVGVDGSDSTEDVLRFAFEHADRHGRDLRAVFCWPPDLYTSSTLPPAPPPERAERWLAEALAGWESKFPDVTVRRMVRRDHAVDGLVAESHSCELLVVGARGHHPRIAQLLGSVSQGVLHHATCPVAVVHGRAREGRS